MKTSVKIKFLALLLFAAGAVFAQISIGIRIGAPPPPRVVRVLPPSPGPEYIWVAGYWYPVGNRYRWHDGYYTRAPYAGARWVEPRHDGQMFYAGYWDGDHGRFDHDHKWDRDRGRDHERDSDRWRDHDHDRH